MTARVLFHVNHLWGVGHFARIAAIANALVEAGGAATVLAGNAVPPGRLDARVKLVELPVIRAADPTYARLVDAAGAPVSAGLWARRAQLIDEALAASAPQVLVTETFPFGRRKLAAELLHLAGAAKSQGAKIAASIRDLPTAPADTRRLEDCAGRLRAHYDAVLIHGDPTIAGLNEIWPGEIPVPARFTGYVTAAIPPAAEARRGVVVSAGGGGDAAPLLQAALAARRAGLLAAEPWAFVTGPAAPASLRTALSDAAPPGCAVLGAVADLPARISRARLAISRGGYNTVIETLAAGTPLVVVPFAPPGEPEQAARAQHFAATGLLHAVDEAALDAPSLAAACERALSAPPPDPARLDFGGAARSAALLAELAAGG